MSEDDPNRGGNFEDVAKALAEEVPRAFERISDIDVDELARTASSEAERARQWIDDLGRWLREQAAGAASGAFPGAAWDEPAASGPAPSAAPADDPLTHAGPHPLDIPPPSRASRSRRSTRAAGGSSRGRARSRRMAKARARATRSGSSASCACATGCRPTARSRSPGATR